MKERLSISKTVAWLLLFIAIVTLAGCQQTASTSDTADTTESASKSQDTTQSSNLNETVGPQATEPASDQTAKGASSTEHEDHADQQVADHQPGMGMGRGMGHGPGMGRGMGRGPGTMGGRREDMTTLHAMFADRDKIKRSVKNLPNGAEATTESDDEAIASLLQEHVPAMESRVIDNKPLPPMTFHPVFVELIKHAGDYTLEYENTDKGVKVTYNAEDPFVVMLVQEHAKLVSRFIKNGMAEIHKPYTLPELIEQREVPAAPTTNSTDDADDK